MQTDIHSYLERFNGGFQGMLRWPQLDALWETLRRCADQGWYIYVVGETPPATPARAEQLIAFIREINPLLREEHDEDYCGIVYVDDPENPSFVKIYDPNDLGVVCGYSDHPPLARLDPFLVTARRPALCPAGARQPPALVAAVVSRLEPAGVIVLTYSHISRMVFHMKTTLNIDDTVMAKLRYEAARQQRTMSELVEAALRLLFRSGRSGPGAPLPPLPKLGSGGHKVDVADHDALLKAMDDR